MDRFVTVTNPARRKYFCQMTANHPIWRTPGRDRRFVLIGRRSRNDDGSGKYGHDAGFIGETHRVELGASL